MGHEMHSAFSTPPPRFCVFFPSSLLNCTLVRAKCEEYIHWNAEITLMKDVLLNVSKIVKIWIGELITFKWMHLSEAFIQSDSNIAFRVYSLSLCVLPEIKHMTLMLPVLCFTIWVPCLPFLPHNNGTSMGTGEKCYIFILLCVPIHKVILLYLYIIDNTFFGAKTKALRPLGKPRLWNICCHMVYSTIILFISLRLCCDLFYFHPITGHFGSLRLSHFYLHTGKRKLPTHYTKAFRIRMYLYTRLIQTIWSTFE